MKTSLQSLCALAAAATLGYSLSSCSNDSTTDFTEVEPFFSVITFENSGITQAGPTSYGANLYSDFDGARFTQGAIDVTPDGVKLRFGLGISEWTDAYEFYAGGMAISSWNYRTTPPSETDDDWWKSYKNQCSVYNLASTDGANTRAGGLNPYQPGVESNSFAIINGCNQSKYNASLENHATEVSFSNSAEFIVQALQVCPTSYVYGCMSEGNSFSKALRDTQGYFCMQVYGYDARGNATNGGKPVTFYFCDYRPTASPVVPYRTGWVDMSLTELGKVNSLRFDFDGSDVGEYGLNTPAYACLDNFMIIFRDIDQK